MADLEVEKEGFHTLTRAKRAAKFLRPRPQMPRNHAPQRCNCPTELALFVVKLHLCYQRYSEGDQVAGHVYLSHSEIKQINYVLQYCKQRMLMIS